MDSVHIGSSRHLNSSIPSASRQANSYLRQGIDSGKEFPFTMLDVTIPIGFLGLFLIGLAVSLKGHSLIAEKDPRMPESLAFENA